MTHAISNLRSRRPARRLRGRRAASLFALLSVLAVGTACTWVPLSEEGEAVALAQAGEVAECKKLGSTTSTVTEKVGFIPRGEARVEAELDALARNKAAEMGGDRVVAVEDPKPGERVYEVYRCDGS